MAQNRIRTGALTAFLATLWGAAAWAGPPFITDDPEPVDLGHWEVYLFSAGAESSHDVTGFGPSVEVNYGAAPNLQLHAIANIAYDSPGDHSLIGGIGDTELGAKYRFITPGEDDWWPQVGVFPLIELPSGNARRNLGAGYTQAFLPIWLQKDFGKWTTYGGGGYFINPGPDNRNFWYVGWLVQRQITEALTLGVEVFHTTASTVDTRGNTGFNVGGQYDFDDGHHLLFSAGRGGTLRAIDPAVGYPTTYYLGYQWTF